MHIETLKVFCDLTELRSFSKTAEKHLLSQSAISQQIAQLELTHKCQLFNRDKRPIELTPAGQAFYDTARDMVDRYERFKNELKNLQKTSTNRINVAAIYSIGMHALPPYVKKFMVQYPNVNVHIEYLDADTIYEHVLNGDIDIGLVAVPKRDKRLEVYDFNDEPLVLACHVNHPLANESQVDIHAVQFEKFIAFGANVPTRQWIDSILQRYNIVVQPVLAFDNIETMKRAIEINSGIGILPKIAIAQELSAGTIKSVEFLNENFVRPTGIIIRRGRILSKAARQLIELLRKRD